MRQIVRASLPLGIGVVLDPFMGAGSTIAAAVAVGYESIGLELDPQFFQVAEQAIPKLARLSASSKGNGLARNLWLDFMKEESNSASQLRPEFL